LSAASDGHTDRRSQPELRVFERTLNRLRRRQVYHIHSVYLLLGHSIR
jgi:hypothetical protein